MNEALAIQTRCQRDGIDPGPLDGLWGPKTRAGLKRWANAKANQGPFPDPGMANVRASYGEPGSNRVWLDLPYPMRLSWNKSQVTWRQMPHAKCSASLLRCLKRVKALYGGHSGVVAVRMDILGGIYMQRNVRGGSHASLHAWAAAIDLDPRINRLGRAWVPDAGMIPWKVIEIFADEGWLWGGVFSRPDAQHFQATRSYVRGA